MMRALAAIVVGLSLLAAHEADAEDPGPATNYWPQFRGPLATGEAPRAKPPLEWNEADGTNVAWKTPIPGRGHSTPIVWGDSVFLTAATPIGEPMTPRPSRAPGNHHNLPVTHRQRFEALLVRRTDGQILWQKQLHEAVPDEQGHYTASLASSSPVTDGEHLFAFFGSYGLFCLDFKGNVVWQKDLGLMQTKHGHGEGSSPALYGGRLFVNWDHEGASFITAFDKSTGEQLWNVARDEGTSWSTPIVIEHEGQAQLIVNGTNRIRAYELETGKVLWQCGGLSANIVASPVFAAGTVYAGSSYNTRSMLAIRLAGAQGDLTQTDHVIWNRFRGTPYVPSLLLYEGGLYFLAHYQNVLFRVDAATGRDRPGPARLKQLNNIYASPVAANGRIYVTDLDGTTVVLSSGDVPRLLAVNRIRESVSASAAIAGDQLFLRGEKHLYCLAEAL